jgi:hypothetical protein
MCGEFYRAIVTVPNTEDKEVGGFFAYFGAVNPNDWRGFGNTRLEAIACLCAVEADQKGEAWPHSGEKFV